MFEVKRLLLGTVAFGLGAVTGYFVSKKMLNKQFREDVADIQAFYRLKLDEFGVMEAEFEPDGEPEGDDDDEDPYENAKADDRADAIASYRGDRRRCVIDYTKPSIEDMGRALRNGVSVVVGANGDDKLGTIDVEAPDEEYIPSDDPEYAAEIERLAEDYARRRTENMQKGEPYLIEPEEYRDGPEDYDQQALYYYAKDRTLCEDDDREVEDEEECVGFDYEDKLDMQTTCWVRNDRLRVLYEIHRIDESYSKAVLGVSETPREREFRIQGRRKKAMDDR